MTHPHWFIEITDLKESSQTLPFNFTSTALDDFLKHLLQKINEMNASLPEKNKIYQIYLEEQQDNPRILSFDWHYPLGQFEQGSWVCTYDSNGQLENQYLEQLKEDILQLKAKHSS